MVKLTRVQQIYRDNQTYRTKPSVIPSVDLWVVIRRPYLYGSFDCRDTFAISSLPTSRIHFRTLVWQFSSLVRYFIT